MKTTVRDSLFTDFLWEATRRNAIYKRDYVKLKKALEKRTFSTAWAKLFSAFKKRWNIFFRYWDNCESEYIVLPGQTQQYGVDADFVLAKLEWCNPEMSIEQIQNAIKSGQKEEEVHPYFHLFTGGIPGPNFFSFDFAHSPPFFKYRDETVYPFQRYFFYDFRVVKGNVQYTARLARNFEGAKPLGLMDCKIDGRDWAREYLVIPIWLLRDYFVTLVSPFDSNELIEWSIKHIKATILKDYNKRMSRRPKYYPSRHKRYMGWFKVYDKVIEKISDKHMKPKFKKGVIDLPEDFTFKEILTDFEIENTPRSSVKDYKLAFEGASEFIRSAPSIKILPHEYHKEKALF